MAAVALILLGAGVFLYLFLRVSRREAELSAVIQVSATTRDKQMAPFHVERFTHAIEQCDKPDRLPELERNLRYWRMVAQAEEMRP